MILEQKPEERERGLRDLEIRGKGRSRELLWWASVWRVPGLGKVAGVAVAVSEREDRGHQSGPPDHRGLRCFKSLGFYTQKNSEGCNLTFFLKGSI